LSERRLFLAHSYHSARIAIGQSGRASHEYDVQTVGAKLHDGIAGAAVRHLNLDVGIDFAILTDQSREGAARDQGRDADAQTATLSRCRIPAVFTAWSS